MRIRVVVIVLILIIGAVPLPLPDSNVDIGASQTVNPIEYHSIATIEHDPINIISDADFMAQATLEAWTGNGTSSNPYLIDGYNITHRGYNIRIENF